MIPLLPSFLAAAGLALIHVFAGQLRFLDMQPRSRWFSAAGGIAVAYVFLHLLPQLGRGQETIRQSVNQEIDFLEYHAYLVALLGLVAFYGLERIALSSRARQRMLGAADATERAVFWVHIGAYAGYNAFIGYILVPREDDLFDLLLFAVAIGVHFVMNDRGLRQHHKADYGHTGRWLLAAGVIVGWFISTLYTISDVMLVALLAFLTGALTLNILKEELPEERESHFGSFALGAIVYSALLLLAA